MSISVASSKKEIKKENEIEFDCCEEANQSLTSIDKSDPYNSPNQSAMSIEVTEKSAQS